MDNGERWERAKGPRSEGAGCGADWGEKDFAFHVPVLLADGSPAISEKRLMEENHLLGAYPVDSIYISCSHTSPASLFGGVWERMINPETGEGVFLLSCGPEEQTGQYGGEKTVVLTEDTLPSHSHGFLDYWSTSAGNANRFAVAVNGDGDGLGGKENDRSYTANAGAGAAHNNMPPYVKVSVWRRIA